jgi:hypothetical protein
MFRLIVAVACLIFIWKAVKEWLAARRNARRAREALAPLAGTGLSGKAARDVLEALHKAKPRDKSKD